MTSTTADTAAGPRVVRAPRGPDISCKGWHQEAALRMLHNNLDPDVAEDPDRLIVYGGSNCASSPSFNDVWVLTNANGVGGAPLWSQLTPVGVGPAQFRVGHGAQYDPVTNNMIVFGGWIGGLACGDTSGFRRRHCGSS